MKAVVIYRKGGPGVRAEPLITWLRRKTFETDWLGREPSAPSLVVGLGIGVAWGVSATPRVPARQHDCRIATTDLSREGQICRFSVMSSTFPGRSPTRLFEAVGGLPIDAGRGRGARLGSRRQIGRPLLQQLPQLDVGAAER